MTLHLRGHHLYCLRFTDMQFHDRGERYQNTYDGIRDTLENQPDSTVQVVLGPDDLCRECPICSSDGCHSKHGDEPVIRKWDQAVLEGLGIEPGREMPVREYQAIVSRKSPLAYCHRCKARMSCEMRALAVSRKGKPPLA